MFQIKKSFDVFDFKIDENLPNSEAPTDIEHQFVRYESWTEFENIIRCIKILVI